MKFINSTALLALSLFLNSGSAVANENQRLIESAAGGDIISQRVLGVNYLKGINGFERTILKQKNGSHRQWKKEISQPLTPSH